MKTNEKLIYLTTIYKNKFLVCSGIIFIHGTDFHVRPLGQTTLFGNFIYHFNPVFLGIYPSVYQSIFLSDFSASREPTHRVFWSVHCAGWCKEDLRCIKYIFFPRPLEYIRTHTNMHCRLPVKNRFSYSYRSDSTRPVSKINYGRTIFTKSCCPPTAHQTPGR